MSKSTQLNSIKRVLESEGKISRNWCLNNYISRLSAYILDLKNEKWNIEGKKVGNDYVYTLLDKPHLPKVQIVDKWENGRLIRVAKYK